VTTRAQLPALPSPTEGNLINVARAVKSILDVREGRAGDPLDAYITYRDLVDSGIAAPTRLPSAGRVPIPVIPIGAEPDGYNPTTDYTIPPRPENVSVTGLFAVIQIQWDPPPIRNFSYAEVWRSTTNVLGNAVLIGTSATQFYADSVGASATRYYWVRFVTQANVTGPYNATNGLVGTTAADPTLILGSLSGQIKESHLFSTLSSRIDLIDAPATTAGSVGARIAAASASLSTLITQESQARTQAITNEAQARSNAIINETDARATALLNEASARATQIGALQTQINTLQAASSGDFSELLSAVQSEQTARIAADTAEAASRETLATQLRGPYTGTDPSVLASGLLYNERLTRISAEESLASSISALSSTVNTNNSTLSAAITSEATTRANADSALSSSLTTLTSSVNDSTTGLAATRATLINDYYTKTAADSAISSAVTALSSSVNSTLTGYVTNSALTQNYYTKAGADAAISQATSSLVSNTALNNALGSYVTSATLSTNYYTKTQTDSAISSATSSLVSTTALNNALGSYTNTATLTTNYYTKTQTDSAISSANSSLVSTTALSNALGSYTNTATLEQNYYTKTQTDGAISSATTTLSSTFTNTLTGYATTAAVQQNFFAKASGESLQGQYTVKIDLAGRVSGFGLASEVTTAGASTSVFAVNANRFYVSAPNDFTQETTPPSSPAGRIWYRPSTNQSFRSTGSGWVSFDPIIPFIVQATPTTINGASVPAGVYLDTAFIRDGTITTAKIGDAQIDNAKIASLNASKITAGSLQVGSFIQSADYVAGVSGWRINADGSAELNNVTSRGNINATSGSITGATIIGGTISTATSGQRIVFDSTGLKFLTGATSGKYGQFKYGQRKYGSGVLVYFNSSTKRVPFYVSGEQNVADIHLYNRTANPSGATYEDGDMIVVNGRLRIYVTALGGWKQVALE
jgi:hypothetical protein